MITVRRASPDDLFVFMRNHSTWGVSWSWRISATLCWFLFLAWWSGNSAVLDPLCVASPLATERFPGLGCASSISIATIALAMLSDLSLLQFLAWVAFVVASPALFALWLYGLHLPRDKDLIVDAEYGNADRGLGIRPAQLSGRSVKLIWVALLSSLVLIWDIPSNVALVTNALAVLALLTSAQSCFDISVGPTAVPSRLRAFYAVKMSVFAAQSFAMLPIKNRSPFRDHGTDWAAWTISWATYAAAASVLRRLYLLIRVGRRERFAAIVVLLQYLRIAAVLGVAATVAFGVALRWWVGTDAISSGDALLAAGAALFPGVSAPQNVAIPGVVSLALGLVGWLLLGLWVAPLGQLFPDWRNFRRQQFEAEVPIIRMMARSLARARDGADSVRDAIVRDRRKHRLGVST